MHLLTEPVGWPGGKIFGSRSRSTDFGLSVLTSTQKVNLTLKRKFNVSLKKKREGKLKRVITTYY